MSHNQAKADRATDLGVVRINNDVITAIASIAAMEVKGVVRMGGGLGKTLCDILTKRTNVKGVRIQNIDGEVKLTVLIIVQYGVDIPRVADEVQQGVKNAVEKMTGLAISEVDVVVEGVAARTPPAGPRTVSEKQTGGWA
jgi:uncharacterized alkaline shock family protein YloU